jgi:hypothetical protein
MADITTISIIGGVVVVGIAATLAVSRSRHQDDLSEYLAPVLRECGVNFISAVYPGLFKTGPFPKFEVRIGPASTVNGVRGECSEYRIVTFSGSKQEVYRLWAVVEFEVFTFKRVRWRAEQKTSLPQSVLPLLENRDD